MSEIDYLYEDPEIPHQQYALLTIVGPNAAQKCTVWGVKVRGTCDSLESAKKLSQRLNSIDPNYDIYTVETGKFVPLVVEPDAIPAEYANKELNTLMKSYLENREKSKELWERNKNEQISKAAAGPSSTRRTPEMVFNTIKTLQGKLVEVRKQEEQLSDSLAEYQDEFDKFTQEERDAVLSTK